MIIEIATSVIGTAIGFVFTWHILRKRTQWLESELRKATSALRSAYVKFGQQFEQYIPFTTNFSEEERKGLKFLGQPIDAISFQEDKIVFYEFKTGKSQLNGNQRRVKKQVEEGKVEFRELRYSSEETKNSV